MASSSTSPPTGRWRSTTQTTGAVRKRIVVADSTDLITFANPRFLTMAGTLGSNTKPHAWAPEAYSDPDRRKYAIVWSRNADRGHTYVGDTKDFQ